MLSIDEILAKAELITLETQIDSITPMRVGELFTSLAEQLRLGVGAGATIGASKLSELSDVMLLNNKDNDILQKIGTKWTNIQLDLNKINQISSFWKLDANGNLYTDLNVYSTQGVSAYGAGPDGEGGATGYDRLDAWSLYTNDKSEWVLSALLGKELHDRVLVLEDGVGGGGSMVVWGTEATGAVPLTVEGVTKTLSLASHTHSGYLTVESVPAWAKTPNKPSYVASEIGGLGTSYRWLTDTYISTWNAKEPAITKLTAFNKNFGTAAGTVAEGNDSRINNGQTAFGWGNHASAGYALNSALTAHINKVDNPHSVTKAQVGLGNVDNTSDANKPVSTAMQTALNLKLNKSIFDDLFEKVEVSTGVYAIKAKYDFYSTGGVSAYGLGSTDGSGGGSMVVWGTESAGAVPLTVEGVTKTLSLASHTHSGYLTTITKTQVETVLTGNITTHTHSQYLTGNQTITVSGDATGSGTTSIALTLANSGVVAGTYNNSATQVRPFTVDSKGRITNIGTAVTIKPAWSSITGKPTTLAGYGITAGLTTNYLTKWNGTTIVNSSIFDNGTNVGIGTTSPAYKLDVYGTGKFKDDILMTFKEWSHATDKNSLNKFLKLFDIDTAGNLVVKTNLYSTGEVTAYKSGTGVSGLTLQGDMNANGKNITGANKVIAGDTVIGNDPLGFLDGDSPGLYNAGNDGIIAAYNNTAGKFYYANGNLIVDYSGVATSPTMKANEFKFGSWTFKQDTTGRLGIYNGTTEVACFNTDGTYVNL